MLIYFSRGKTVCHIYSVPPPTPQSGGYVLGFRVDPPDRLQEVFKEVSSLHRLFSVNPAQGTSTKGVGFVDVGRPFFVLSSSDPPWGAPPPPGVRPPGPIFGIEFTVEEKPPSLQDLKEKHKVDDIEIINGRGRPPATGPNGSPRGLS